MQSRELSVRVAAVRAAGRVYEWRPGDQPDIKVGDALVAALNDKEGVVRAVAMQSLGTMRYQRAIQSLSELLEFYRTGELADAAFTALTRIAHPSSAAVILPRLMSPNVAIKMLAIEGIGRIGDKAHLSAIQNALQNERNDDVLLASSFAATLLGHRAVDPIVDALRRPKTRERARLYLAELAIGGRQDLTAWLKDPDPKLRADVTDAVALSRDPAALPLVRSLVTDSDPQVARSAARAVAWLR
jgi:HEAT repeat protein